MSGKLVKVVKTEEKLPWMGSLEVVHQDELPDLREAVVPKGAPTGGRGAEKEGSDSSSSGKEKKKKKERKKKKKEKKVERKAEGSKEGRPQTAGGRFLLKGQKELSAVFGGTGLDPSPAVRRRIRRKARKAARRSSRKSSSTSGSSSSSSEETDMSQEGLFPETKKVKGMAKRSPGALSNQTIEEMKESLLTMSGQMWHMEHDSPAPPLVRHYFRTVLRPKMSGGLAREALTLAFVVDLALQGRIAEAVDTALQRVKSLELSANGTDFRVSQRIELAPTEGEAVTSPTERREALSEAKDEAKLRYQSGKGGDWWKGDSWKKHDWDRKGKKGDPKGNKGDGKKGEKGADEKGGAGQKVTGANLEQTPQDRGEDERRAERREDANNLSNSLGAGMTREDKDVVHESPNYEKDACGRVKPLDEDPTPTTEVVELGLATTQLQWNLLEDEKGSEEVADLHLAGRTFCEASECIKALWLKMEFEGVVRCKTMSTGKGIFPLPIVTSPALTDLVGELGTEKEMFFNLCRGLNSLGGVSAPMADHRPNLVQKGALKFLRQQALRMSEWPEKFDDLSWDEFFRVKGVDYRGEEVLTARFTGWEHVGACYAC